MEPEETKEAKEPEPPKERSCGGLEKKTLQSLHKAIKNPCVLPLLLNGITRYHGIGII